jgi:magnesium-transporting ATPase (P-type)
MLTGDKLETAINIGYSCQLLDKKTKIFKIMGKNINEISVEF